MIWRISSSPKLRWVLLALAAAVVVGLGALSIALGEAGSSWRELGAAVVGGSIVGFPILAIELHHNNLRASDDTLRASTEVQRELARLVAGSRDLEAIDLRATDLSALSLRDRHLARANLSGAVLAKADLRDADLSEAVLIGTDLSQSVLAGASFRGSLCIDCNFTGASSHTPTISRPSGPPTTSPGPDFSDATLINCTFDGVTLRNTSFKSAEISGGSFHDARLRGCSFENARTRTTLVGDDAQALEWSLDRLAASPASTLKAAKSPGTGGTVGFQFDALDLTTADLSACTGVESLEAGRQEDRG